MYNVMNNRIAAVKGGISRTNFRFQEIKKN